MSETVHSAPSGRARKLRAVLAGGLVLGVGAAITLAAWNDSEFASEEFSAGSFNLEGSVNDIDWGDHNAAGTAGQLDFSVDTSNLAPGDSVSAAFAVRLDADTSYDADVLVKAAEGSQSLPGLTYSLVQTDGFGTDAQPITPLVQGAALNEVPEAAGFRLTEGAADQPGDPVYLTFTVTADDNLPQGGAATATWEFSAESTDGAASVGG